MYLRSHFRATGRHVYNIEALLENHWNKFNSVSIERKSEANLNVFINSQELFAILERGMSEGERAVTTPHIGWRKLTDPGD